MRYLLDTNVISEMVAKRPDPRVLRWLSAQNPDDIYLSVITIGELSKGIERLPASKRKETLRSWLHDDLLARFSGHILTLDVDVMLTWGRMTSRLQRSGRPLPAIDSLLAVLAEHHHCVLVMRNAADYSDIGLTVLNPWAD